MSKAVELPSDVLKPSDLDNSVFIIYKEDDQGMLSLPSLPPENKLSSSCTVFPTPVTPASLDALDISSSVKSFNFDSDLNVHIETNSHLVSDSSEYTEHFLSQLTADPLVLSSSQVSSVLLELEPNQSPLVHGTECHQLKNSVAEKCPTLTSLSPIPIPSPFPAIAKKKKDPSTTKYHDVKCLKVVLGDLTWFRCSLCPFLASVQELISFHYVQLHADSVAAQLRCLSCELSFTRLQTLKNHYVIEHLVSLSDLQTLTKLTIEANIRWRADQRKGKSPFVDSIITESIIGEEDVSLVDKLFEIEDNEVGTEVLPHPPESPEISVPSPFPTLSTLVEKWFLPSDDTSKIQGNVEHAGSIVVEPKQMKEEEFKGATIKPEKREKTGWKCPTNGCQHVSTTERNLEYHKMCHDGGPNQWKCFQCSQQFTKWAQVSIHLWKNHQVDVDLYSCDLCNYKTNNVSRLMKFHRRIHSDERPFLCDLCGLGFKTTKQLGTHKMYHRKGRKRISGSPPSCSICSRKFTEPRLLKAHVDIVHRGIRMPYICNVCNHSASSRFSLKMHQRTHTGEKPYSCPECPFATADHNSLRRHKMRHSGAKHYKCPHCPYASIQSATYKNHLKSRHPEMDDGLMFSCEHCSYRTVNNEIFLSHISTHLDISIGKSAGTLKVDSDSIEQCKNGANTPKLLRKDDAD
ncbi:ZnF_C2H2 [Nesidiocoris tenuis]|uniref:ZnF_C2H2 n=1 Tax=Nesidiocoris tenuis TaxID=355587 RepID=A0ABN7AS31_9HEMI|nr:ZnF_C2H2 [Nesidiocoris tenuis]